MPWLRLIRWKNLVIVLLTQFLVWWCVILPERPVVLTPFDFSLIALSTLLIAAAGYIINDYFDIKIDLVNKPEKVVLEKVIPRKQAIISHAALSIIAFLLACYVAARAHHYEWLLVQVVCILLLWFYSTHFKRQFVTGNVVISVLTALVILTLFIYEPAVRIPAAGKLLSQPGWVIVIYSFFAFMLTWMREVVKDMEDHIGDEADGCRTMPVTKGLQYAANFTTVLCSVTVIPLVYAAAELWRFHFNPLATYVVFLILLLVVWAVFLKRGSATAKHYHNASSGLKIIMLLGVLSLIIYHFQILSQYAL